MKSLSTLAILLLIGIVGGFLVIFGGYYFIHEFELSTPESIPLLVGIMGFLASIVTAISQEISSRYKEKRDRASRRWELVFPMIKEAYNPWINSARRLRDSLTSKGEKFSDSEINQVLYYCCLFYGRRLQFILDHGDSIMLGTIKDENNVNECYNN